MAVLTLIYGAVVGLSLGLTGGGGAIFAVPLLVYGLSVDARQAVGISLAAVGITSLVGFLGRWTAGQVEVGTGLVFAAAGMVGAPVGSWLSMRISESLLLTLFAGLMIVVAVRMWRKNERPLVLRDVRLDVDEGPTCRRDAMGRLRLTTPCAALLGVVGVAAGVLSGLFGVGGGFIIVPALVLFSGMAIHRAVGTSLLVIALVSGAGVAAHLWAGRDIPLDTTLYFVGGGVMGMIAGIAVSRYLSGPALRRVFAVAIGLVAMFVILRTAPQLWS
jgi:uncharacterized membrane protein YfcA